MSVQMYVCTPLKFFEGCPGIKPKKFCRKFTKILTKEVDVELAQNSTAEEICEDIWYSEVSRMLDLAEQHGQTEAAKNLGGDLCVPSEQSIKRRISFPWTWFSGEAGEVYTISTADFKESIDAIEPIVREHMEENEAALAHLDLFKQAIAFAENHSLPILWSV